MTKYAFRWIYDFEKAEAWLNAMAAKGWMMQSYFAGLYRFSKGVPGEYTYHMELLPYFAWSGKNQDYLQFIQETDVELVSLWVKWAVFRKKTGAGAFDIYTDTDLRKAHYLRVSRFLSFFCVIEWCLTLLVGGVLIRGWVFENPATAHSIPYGIHVFLFSLLFGFLIFNAARRARKKYKRLQKEEPFIEYSIGDSK